MADDDRRRFLKVATCALGGGVGLAVGVPVLRVLFDPTGKQTVTSPTEPFDLGPVEQFQLGAPPRRVEIIAPLVKDGWTAASNVILGAAWVRRIGKEPDAIDARSAVCPHLGCAVGYDAAQNNFLCPCHDSRFAVDGGAKMSGPSERGLDQLPIAVASGRLLLTWERYKIGGSKKEPV
jgi:quinol---cytochrome c reductase iron-sulfur subunit, bacillus type